MVDETRLEALKLALAFCGDEKFESEFVIEVATQFYKFLQGKTDDK